jgi:hypothetical protein
MPKFISVDEIEEGMVLAKDVVNSFGQTMVRANQQIESKHIPIFSKWNVTGVFVIGDNEGAEITQEAIKKVKTELLTKMTWKPESPIEIDMFKASILTRAGQPND